MVNARVSGEKGTNQLKQVKKAEKWPRGCGAGKGCSKSPAKPG